MNGWQKTIKFINRFPYEKWTFTPKDVKEHLSDENADTIALYVNYLHKAGFLKRTGRGVYRKVQDIPPDLTLTQLKRFAYPKGATWEDRKRIVTRYWKLKNIKDNI